MSASLPSSIPALGPSTLQQQLPKTFAIGPGHAPVPGKLVRKIIDGEFVEFVELADLLSVNVRAEERLRGTQPPFLRLGR